MKSILVLACAAILSVAGCCSSNKPTVLAVRADDPNDHVDAGWWLPPPLDTQIEAPPRESEER